MTWQELSESMTTTQSGPCDQSLLQRSSSRQERPRRVHHDDEGEPASHRAGNHGTSDSPQLRVQIFGEGIQGNMLEVSGESSMLTMARGQSTFELSEQVVESLDEVSSI